MILDFFDDIIVVSLPHRLDRRSNMIAQMEKHCLPFRFFDATWDQNNGAHGLMITMKSLLSECLSKRMQNVIILEDDAKFLLPPEPFLKEIIPQIPKKYDLFYLGLNPLAQLTKMSTNVLKVKDCYSTHAICYSKQGMELVLDRMEYASAKVYDIFMREEVVPRGMSYCTYPMRATQDETHSDIEKTQPKWGQLMAMSYAMHTKKMSIMATEIAYCIGQHQIGGVTPEVDEQMFEVQHPELIGQVCDCQRFVYDEGKCETCNGDRWRVQWKEKGN